MGETGELVGSGYPVVSLVDLKDVWVTFNLREDLLKDIRVITSYSIHYTKLYDPLCRKFCLLEQLRSHAVVL